MARIEASAQDYVLRAMAATEIAESCCEPKIRASFFDLAEAWLAEAAKAEDGAGRYGGPELRAH